MWDDPRFRGALPGSLPLEGNSFYEEISGFGPFGYDYPRNASLSRSDRPDSSQKQEPTIFNAVYEEKPEEDHSMDRLPKFSCFSGFSHGLCLLLLIGLLGIPASWASEPQDDAQDAEPQTGRAKTSDGLSIAYSYWNRPSSSDRPTLVFVHGWSCDRSYWSSQTEAFAGDYPVVTLDLAGHGSSDIDRAQWTLDAFGEDIRAVVDALGLEQVVLIGHSMGGPAVLAAAPRLGKRVLGVVGVDTFHNVEFQMPPEQWKPILDAYRSDYRGTCAQFTGSMFLGQESELRHRITEDMCSGPQDVGLALMEEFGRFDGKAAFSAVQAPIRSLNAARGFQTAIEINRKYSPGFDAVVMDEVGHFLMMEEPETFNRHLAEILDGLLNPKASAESLQ